MARTKHDPAYLVEEPTTGLYAIFNPENTVRLTYRNHATRFQTANAARVAVAEHVGDQPHEIVRVSA